MRCYWWWAARLAARRTMPLSIAMSADTSVLESVVLAHTFVMSMPKVLT